MFTKEQNDLLTLTGPGTPMGGLIRRYWVPALLAEEIPEPDSPPVQVRILGEELVAFRDSKGRIGLLEEGCSHRGTSLFYGRNEDCGLRCGYHGWKYDVNGNVLDMPAEPLASRFKEKVKHPSYPTREVAGIIFAYMGPRELVPALPNYVWTKLPLGRTYVTKSFLDCNWLQGLEGECDSAHLNFLHRIFGDKGYEDLYQEHYPSYETEETDFGVRLIALREAPPDKTYVRVSSFVMPLSCWVPARTKEVHMYVPIDDRSCWRWDFGMTPQPRDPSQPIPRRDQIDSDFRRFRHQGNHYLIDREQQRHKTFLGLGFDFLNHDAMATETMGHVYDRRREHLGTSDKGVIAVRRRLLNAIEAYRRGEQLPHIVKDSEAPMAHIDTITEFIPNTESWRDHFPHLTKTGIESVRV